MTDHAGPRQLRRLLDAVMSVSSDLDLATVLSHIVEAARAWGARTGSPHATRSYSWMSPPRTSLRETLFREGGAVAGLDRGFGATSPRPR